MKSGEDHAYALLRGTEERLEELIPKTGAGVRSRFWLKNAFYLALVITQGLALTSLGFWFGIHHHDYCSQREERRQYSEIAWSKGLSEIKAHWLRFDGSLYSSNKYRGPPGPEIDSAWDRFTDNEWMPGTAVVLNVSVSDIEVSSNTAHFDSVVQLDEANGGGYMGSLGLFHQLHCLNMLRKWTHFAHYHALDPTFWSEDTTNFHLREHTDHCIDMLRQVLMCNSDTGLIMFHWAQGVGAPVPDFSTAHQCRDPEQVLQWAQTHAAPITHHIWKKGGEAEVKVGMNSVVS